MLQVQLRNLRSVNFPLMAKLLKKKRVSHYAVFWLDLLIASPQFLLGFTASDEQAGDHIGC
jgi:hypothetical protein